MGLLSDISMMFPKKLDRNKFEDLYSDYKDLLNKMSLDENLDIRIYKSKLYNGVASSSKYIIISDSLLRLYSENPYAVRCMIGHELAHVKFHDFGFYKMIIGFGVAFGSNYCRAVNLLIEIRAEIETYRINSFTDEQFFEIHTTFKQHNNGMNKEESYKVGYPNRDDTIDLCIKHKSFTNDLINEILIDFCHTMKVDSSEKLISSVKKKFAANV